MQQNHRRLRLILLAGLCLLVILVFFVLNRGRDSKNISLVASQLPVAQLGGIAYDRNQSIVFSNGRSFIKYNPSEGKTTVLSNDGLLPDISKISISPDGSQILFQTPSQSFNDDLGKILQQQKLPLDQPYWWLLDIQSKSIRPIPSTILNVHWSKKPRQFVALVSQQFEEVEDGESDVLVNYDSTTLIGTQLVAAEAARDFSILDDGFLTYNSDRSITKINTNGDRQTVQSNVQGVSFREHTSQYVAVNSENLAEETEVILYNNGKREHVFGTFHEPVYEWAQSSVFFGGQGNDALRVYDAEGKNINAYKVSLNNKPTTGFTVIAASNKTHLIAQKGDNLYVLGDKAAANLAPINPGRLVIGDAEIQYFPSENSFIANIVGENTPAKRKLVYEGLIKNNVNPDLVTIRFTETNLMEHPPE